MATNKMSIRAIIFFLAALFALAADAAVAGESGQYPVNLRIEPAVPSAGQAITLVADGGGCDLFGVDDPLAREISQLQNTIQVDVRYIYSLGPCPVPPHTYRWNIGAFPPGSYRIELYGEDELYFPRALLEAIDITITPAPTVSLPATIPSVNWSGVSALICGFVLIGALAFSSIGGLRR